MKRFSRAARIAFVTALGASTTIVFWALNRGNNTARRTEQSNSEQFDLIMAPKPITRDSFDYEVYATDPRSFQTWVDATVDRLHLPTILVALIFAMFVFLGGLFLAIFIDFQQAYLRTGPIYVGLFGIFWVFIFIRYGSVNFHGAYEELRPCFLVDDQQYKSHIEYWFRRFTDKRGNALYFGSLSLFASLAVYAAFFHFDLFQDVSASSLRPSLLRNTAWYAPGNEVGKALIIGYYGVFVALLLGTAIRLIVLNFLFLLSLRRFSVIPLADAIKTRLQNITTIYVAITLSWFVGVGLFGAVLFNDLDALSILGLASLSLLGILTFLTPQFIYRILLVRSKFFASKWILAALYNKFQINLQERGNNILMPSEVGVELANMEDLAGFVEASSHGDLWVYNPGDIILIIVAQFLALASVFAEDFFKAAF